MAGLFYDYDKGEASYEAPAGVMTGEIISKWQYKIRNGRMIYAFESDTKIDDDILKEELGSSSDVQLKNIVRTIQKEQNAIIRNQRDKILVIQGAAGSGKTSVSAPSGGLSSVSRQEESEGIRYPDPFAQQCFCGLYFSHPPGTGRGKYPGNEF